MNTRSRLLTAALFLTGLGLAPANPRAQVRVAGVPGSSPPGSTALVSTDTRTPISSVPYDINQSGSYYLTANLTVSTGNAITIYVDGVTLDLNGFTIHSTAVSPNGYAIGMSNGLKNLTILNGSITGGVVHTGGGNYSGTGFAYGIQGSPANCRTSGISVAGCLLNGIYLEGASVVESCTVKTAGQYGLVASTVSNSVALDCGGFGVAAEQVSNSRGQSTAAGGIGLYAFKQALNCQGSAGTNGTGLKALTATNCYGDSVNGIGLSATSATNCQGVSVNETGLFAATAQGSQGTSTSGTGLAAATANNCVGTSVTGTGLTCTRTASGCHGKGASGIRVMDNGQSTGTALNCYGSSTGGGTGISARIVTGSFGESSSSWGILCTIANSCDGTGVPTGVFAVYRYDMP